MCALLWVTGQQVRTKMETDYKTSDSKSAELKLYDDDGDDGDGVSTIHSTNDSSHSRAKTQHYNKVRHFVNDTTQSC